MDSEKLSSRSFFLQELNRKDAETCLGFSQVDNFSGELLHDRVVTGLLSLNLVLLFKDNFGATSKTKTNHR